MLKLFLLLGPFSAVKLCHCIGFGCFYISVGAQIHRAVGRYTDEKKYR